MSLISDQNRAELLALLQQEDDPGRSLYRALSLIHI